jgi:hypothetical protein
MAMQAGDMANVVCLKCSATAISKCPVCRNVFPTNRAANMVKQLVTVEYEKVGKYKTPDAVARLTYYPFADRGEGDLKDGDVTKNMVGELIGALTSYLKHFEEVSCKHEWQFATGQSSSIGCGHGRAFELEETKDALQRG